MNEIFIMWWFIGTVVKLLSSLINRRGGCSFTSVTFPTMETEGLHNCKKGRLKDFHCLNIVTTNPPGGPQIGHSAGEMFLTGSRQAALCF